MPISPAPRRVPIPPARSSRPALVRRPAGYRHLSGNVPRRIVAAMRRQAAQKAQAAGKVWGRACKRAKIGLYRRRNGPEQLVFIGFGARTYPPLTAELRSTPASGELDSFLLGAGVSQTTSYPAGPLGGVLRCGTERSSGVAVTMCAWADHSSLAILPETGISRNRLASLALAFRDAAEH